jgi:hypothetical protein
VSHRPLALLSGLTLGDYLLWNWSLSANRGVLALVSGLSLPPLALICLSLLVVNLSRLLARSAHRVRVAADDRRRTVRARSRRASDSRARTSGARTSATAGGPPGQAPAPVASSPAPSPGKLAA